jgi:hypothetical protein
VETDALNQLTRQVNGRGGVRVSAEVSIGHMAAIVRADAQRKREFLASMRAIPFPAVLFPVSAGNLVTPVNSSLLGPEDGQVWDVRRVTLSGWTTADAALSVNLFREQNTPTTGNPQNRLRKFNDNAPGNETWSPGGGLVLHAPDALLITGGSFTTTTGIFLNLEGVQFAAEYEADYLI